RRSALCARQLQRGAEQDRPVGGGASRAAAGRVHRRHSVSRDTELRETPSRHRRRLPSSVWWGPAAARQPEECAAAEARPCDDVETEAVAESARQESICEEAEVQHEPHEQNTLDGRVPRALLID